MHNPLDENGENEFQKRTEILEEMLRNAELNWKPIEYSLIFDELGRDEQESDIYCEGIKMKADLSKAQIEAIKIRLGLIEAKPKKKANLRAIAESYSREDETRSAPPEPERRVQLKAYSIAQYENDRGIVGYYKIKHPNLRNYEDAKNFLEAFGTPTLTTKGGEPRPLKECAPSRVIAAAIGKYEDAQTRLKEKENHLREIVNGTP
jgi:hypothetical protein